MLGRVVRGAVDQRTEHFRITFGDPNDKTESALLVALVGRSDESTFLIDIKIDVGTPSAHDIIQRVEEEVRFYLVEKEEPHPWKYAKHHCSTGANLYSTVHWTLVSANE
jgi:hypothetical protein